MRNLGAETMPDGYPGDESDEGEDEADVLPLGVILAQASEVARDVVEDEVAGTDDGAVVSSEQVDDDATANAGTHMRRYQMSLERRVMHPTIDSRLMASSFRKATLPNQHLA